MTSLRLGAILLALAALRRDPRIPDEAEPIFPGVYGLDDTLHIDMDEYIRACGGDPENPRDVATAHRVINRVAAEHGIVPTEGD